MITILVYGPDFACSENLTAAFGLRDDVRLISITPSDWRDYDPGLLLSDEKRDEARELVEQSRLVVLGDATAMYTLARVCGERGWENWARKLPLMAYFGDSAYFKNPEYYDGLCESVGVQRLFLLPNLMPLTSLDAVPLHHPMPVERTEKAEALTVMHAPGRDGKALQKGTPAIEEVIHELQTEREFDYQRLVHMTLQDCLALKATAHIVIDQMPPDGKPAGMGRTGTEALAAGSAVLTALYDTSVLDGYFDAPPVEEIHTQDELRACLVPLLDDPELLARRQDEGYKWALDNISFENWLTYVEKYL